VSEIPLESLVVSLCLVAGDSFVGSSRGKVPRSRGVRFSSAHDKGCGTLSIDRIFGDHPAILIAVRVVDVIQVPRIRMAVG
jgi:hypothetical protein